MRQLVFDKNFCATYSGAEMLRQIEKEDFDTLHNVYSVFSDLQLYYAVYCEMKSKKGNMTPGIDGVTLDGVHKGFFEKLRQEMVSEQYQPQPTKHVYIPKSNGKTRSLGLPSIKDKIIQSILNKLLTSIYEKRFNNRSHGYRLGRGCYTIAKSLRSWFGIS